MDPQKMEPGWKVPSGVEKRTLRGLYGRVKQVEGRVDAAYRGLNDAVDGKMAGILAVHMEAVEKQISALQSEIARIRNALPPILVSEDLSQPAVETPDRGVQPT